MTDFSPKKEGKGIENHERGNRTGEKSQRHAGLQHQFLLLSRRGYGGVRIQSYNQSQPGSAGDRLAVLDAGQVNNANKSSIQCGISCTSDSSCLRGQH
jgi:hypothetical protein